MGLQTGTGDKSVTVMPDSSVNRSRTRMPMMTEAPIPICNSSLGLGFTAIEHRDWHFNLTPFPLMYGQREEELPYEVILAIQRVLELHSGQETDPLDVLSDDFSPVDVLNIFFPDGVFQSACIQVFSMSEAILGSQRPR